MADRVEALQRRVAVIAEVIHPGGHDDQELGILQAILEFCNGIWQNFVD
ncbi:MAG: hypothetical protein LBB34_00020 [Holosporales bacterium]|nr:hypothetical protein [Holosporales bacterium]